jgi:lipopolysaccharide biosynthesis glycosyltransferase
MLMNLSRLRTFDWERKAIKFYEEYKKDLVFGDQDIINIIFHYYPGTYKLKKWNHHHKILAFSYNK